MSFVEEDTLFSIETIKIIVIFMWQKFFKHIMSRIFLPFMIYFIIFIVHITFIYENWVKSENSKDGAQDFFNDISDQTINTPNWVGHIIVKGSVSWLVLDKVFLSIIIGFWLYFLIIELQ